MTREKLASLVGALDGDDLDTLGALIGIPRGGRYRADKWYRRRILDTLMLTGFARFWLPSSN